MMIGLFGNPTKKDPELKFLNEFLSGAHNPTPIIESKPRIVWIKFEEKCWFEAEITQTYVKSSGQMFPGKILISYTGRKKNYDPTEEFGF